MEEIGNISRNRVETCELSKNTKDRDSHDVGEAVGAVRCDDGILMRSWFIFSLLWSIRQTCSLMPAFMPE